MGIPMGKYWDDKWGYKPMMHGVPPVGDLPINKSMGFNQQCFNQQKLAI